MNKVIAAALLAVCTLAHAEPTPAKKALIDKVLELQRPAIEASSRGMVEQPAVQVLQRVGQFLQARVAPEKREAVFREVQADMRKFVDDNANVVRDKALKLMPTTMGPALDERFTEAELKQLIGALESPAYRKYQQTSPEMLKTMADKLLPDVRVDLEPKFKVLEQTVTKRLDAAAATPPAAAASSPK